jgi:hypothetical protein
VKFGLWIVLITLAVSNTALAQPRVTKASVSGKELRLQGNDFGAQQCRQCEVIAHFGNFKYSLDVISWNDKSIKAHLADLGKGTRASIRVVTEAGPAKPVKVRVPEQRLPKRASGKWVKQPNKDLLSHTRRYDSSLGGKGEEKFDVGQPWPACQQSAPVFDSAEIVLGRRTRFGEAQIVRMPEAGCEKCQVTVRYYWEPTGRLEYQLHVNRKIVEGVCKAQMR